MGEQPKWDEMDLFQDNDNERNGEEMPTGFNSGIAKKNVDHIPADLLGNQEDAKEMTHKADDKDEDIADSPSEIGIMSATDYLKKNKPMPSREDLSNVRIPEVGANAPEDVLESRDAEDAEDAGDPVSEITAITDVPEEQFFFRAAK